MCYNTNDSVFLDKEKPMRKEYVMGNGAIALGALAAGVNLVAGYPGAMRYYYIH